MQHRIRSKIKKVPQGFSKKKWKPNNWIPMFTYLQIGMHRNIHDLPQIWNSLFIWISRILNENAPEFLQNKYLLSIKFLKSDILNWLVCYKHCIKFVDTHKYFVSKYKPSFPKFWTDCCGSKKYKYPNLKEFEIISSLYNWWFELIHNPHLRWVLLMGMGVMSFEFSLYLEPVVYNFVGCEFIPGMQNEPNPKK